MTMPLFMQGKDLALTARRFYQSKEMLRAIP
jgi:hypothetical protein